ncbi:MAG: type I 3-dehydroquinate dehydratase [Calditrichaeota bacterium]|nr:MAG: type I 3-dehydroquinate dehydratase [Calditrichota bacterium]
MSGTGHSLCVSLLPRSKKELEDFSRSCPEADVIEIRIDFIPDIKFQKLRELFSQPLVVTLRTTAQGGYWEGSETEYTKIIKKALSAQIDYVDVEWQHYQQVIPTLNKKHSSKIILSNHTPEHRLDVLKDLLLQMKEIPADVYKLVFPVESFWDNLTALKLAEFARSLEVPFIIHGNGEAGTLSRILGAISGNVWTYVSAQINKETAPGQLPLHEARHYYHLHQKSTSTRLIGLVGNPIQQSKGWRLHNALIHQYVSPQNSSDFLYVNFPVEDLKRFWVEWNEHLFGLSVTIPYKEEIVPYLTECSTEVLISGVCNTVVRTKNGWKGFNTDLLALESLLKPHREILKDGALVVGTGATARSAIAALKRLEVSPIFVVGRNSERGRLLSEKFNVEFLEEDEVHYAGAAAVIQTTPVGMYPNVDQYPVGSSHFRRGRLVLDVIYNPPETRFLKIARDRGCITISGEEMFLLQAAKQFELFTGVVLTMEQIREVWNHLSEVIR